MRLESDHPTGGFGPSAVHPRRRPEEGLAAISKALLEDRRAAPAPPKPWYRRYGPAIFLGGILVAALGLVLTMAFIADETAKAYSGDFDQATWQEPGLPSTLGLEAPSGLVGGAPDSLQIVRETPSGPVAWTVAPDGQVTMRPLDEPVTWPDAKAAFEQWLEAQALPAPQYQDIRVVADGESIPEDQLLA